MVDSEVMLHFISQPIHISHKALFHLEVLRCRVRVKAIIFSHTFRNPNVEDEDSQCDTVFSKAEVKGTLNFIRNA